MKELSIKEKAKRYDEAIGRAEKALEVLGTDKCEGARQIFSLFPELKESEDERIRKAIHIYLDWLDGRKDYAPRGEYTIRDMIAWLEKQSTPQVRTGLEWINTIDDACDKRYAEEYAHGEYCHEQSFKWGFQEGVDWLEQQGEPTNINPSEFDLRLNKLLKQFETLSKEELASSLSFYLNVVQNDGTYKADEKKGEQKSAKWSEEDEERIKNILSVLGVQVCWDGATGKKGNPYQKEIDWLKSLKDRYTWKPSEEQLEALKNAIHIKPFENPSDSLLWGLYEQIKKLKEKLPK